MGKILSQEEIDALLGSNRGPEAPRDAQSADAAITYNFRRPDRVSKEQIRSIHFLHDRFARNVSTSLSAFLRAVTEVSIVSVEQFTYSEFLMSVPDPTAFYSLALQPAEGLGALELNPVVAFTMIDRMLGGSGQRVAVNRALTEIEQNVVDSVVKVILDNLTETWSPLVAVQFRISGRETRPQMLQVAAPNEAMILLVFDIRVSEARGMLNLCIPTAVIESFGASFMHGYYRTRRLASDTERSALFENLGRVTMPLTAVLETQLSARELLALRAGDIVSLGVPASQPITVRVGSIASFEGHPVQVGSHAGIELHSAPAHGPAGVAGRA